MSHLKFSVLILLAALHGCGGSDEEKARSFVLKGQSHLAEGNRDAAKIEFTNALRLDGTSVDALYQLSLFQEENRNWPQFEDYLKRLLILKPDHYEARLKLTQFYIGSGQTELAKVHADYLHNNHPESKDITLVRATILYKSNQDKEAKVLVDEVLAEYPNDVDAVFLLVNDYIQKAKFAESIELLDESLKTHPDNLMLNMAKINVLSRTDNWAGTIPVYRHLITVYPGNPSPSASLAQVYAKLGDAKESVSVLEDFAKKNNNAQFYIKAVEIVAVTQGLEASESSLKEYIKTNPELVELRLALADLYIQTNRVDLAYSEVQEIKANSADSKIKFQAMNRLARLDFAAGKMKEANETVESILKGTPDDVSALALKSNILIKEDKAENAVKILRGALRDNSDSAELLLTLGRAHEQLQQWELANENYAKSLKLSPGKPLQTILYAEFLMKRNDINKAEELLEPLINSEIRNPKAVKLFAQIMINKMNWDKALRATEMLKAIDGDTAEVALLQGIVYSGKSDMKSALESFQHLYKLSPDSDESQNLLVQAYIKADKRKEAEDVIEKILKSDPQNFNGYILKANTFAYYKEWPNAISASEKAISTDPKQLKGHDILIKLLIQTAQFDKALDAINRGLVELPNDVTLSVYKASLFQQQNNTKKSIEVYQDILDKNPKLDVIANNLAVLLQNEGGEENLKRAAEIASRFRQTTSPAFQDTLGWIYVQQGNAEEAEALLKRAADKLPNEAEVQYHLGAALQLSKKNSAALKQLTTAVNLAKNQNITPAWLADAEKQIKLLDK